MTRSLLAVTLVALAALVCWQVWSRHLIERFELWLHGEQPVLFYLELSAELLDDYSRVFGVAHNSGDRISTTRAALEYGADVVEIDVISLGNQLYAAHSAPPSFIREGFYQGPRLEMVWAAAREADVVSLDLKESSPRYLDMVVRFLNAHRDHEVIVSTRDPASLSVLAAHAPHAYRFLSIGAPAHLAALQPDARLIRLIDGVTIRESLIDAETAEWLLDHDLLVIAWTVNRVPRMNELVKLGVHGITTDNLAIIELLGGSQRQEAILATVRDAGE